MTLSHITIDGGTDDTPIGNIGDRIKSDSSLSTAGSSTVKRATATTSWVAYPSSASNDIISFSVECDIDNPGGRRLWVSLNNTGVDYTVLAPGDTLSMQPKSTKQIYIRTASSTAVFSIWQDISPV